MTVHSSTPSANSNPNKAEVPSDAPRLALRPKDAAKALGIGERLLWSMTNRGEIPHIKLGKCVLYPVAELERWLVGETAKVGKRGSRSAE